MTDIMIKAEKFHETFHLSNDLPLKDSANRIIEGSEIDHIRTIRGVKYNILIRHYVRRVAQEGGYTGEHSANVIIRDLKNTNGFIDECTILPRTRRLAKLNSITFEISHKHK